MKITLEGSQMIGAGMFVGNCESSLVKISMIFTDIKFAHKLGLNSLVYDRNISG